MRPHRFYLVFSDYGAPTRVVAGQDGLYRATGTRHGLSFKSRLAAEEFAAWRDYDVLFKRHGLRLMSTTE